jgi:hypothetical protein
MSYLDKIVTDPEGALKASAARKNVSRDELAQRLTRIRRTAADNGLHLTLSQAKSYFEGGSSRYEAMVTHVNGCAYCKALVDCLQPDVSSDRMTATMKALEKANSLRSTNPVDKPTLQGLLAFLFRPAPAFATVILMALTGFLAFTFGKRVDDVQVANAPVGLGAKEYLAAEHAFRAGRPAEGYMRLTTGLEESGLPEAKLAPVRQLKNFVEAPIRKEDQAKVLDAVISGGKPVDLGEIKDAMQAERTMTRLAQIGDHPRALAALQVYLNESGAPREVQKKYVENVGLLRTAAAQADEITPANHGSPKRLDRR